jgi:hypothetical protein
LKPTTRFDFQAGALPLLICDPHSSRRIIL